jgi:hypothetical protein
MRIFRFIIACGIGLVLIACLDTQRKAPQIWGMWNTGGEGNARYNGRNSTGLYAVTFDRLSIEPGDGTRARISAQGFAFYILDIQGEYPSYSLSVEILERGISGNNPRKFLKGHISIHFQGEDRMWMEGSDISKNDEGFPARFFEGDAKVFWRAKKIDNPLEESE